MTGCVLTASEGTNFDDKLRHFDSIEGYIAKDPPAGLYERDIVTAHLENGETKKCFMYHRTNIDVETATQIPSGDWLKREDKEFK